MGRFKPLFVVFVILRFFRSDCAVTHELAALCLSHKIHQTWSNLDCRGLKKTTSPLQQTFLSLHRFLVYMIRLASAVAPPVYPGATFRHSEKALSDSSRTCRMFPTRGAHTAFHWSILPFFFFFGFKAPPPRCCACLLHSWHDISSTAPPSALPLSQKKLRGRRS